MSCLTGPAATGDPIQHEQGRTIMTNPQRQVAGIDSHKDTIHVAVINATGAEVADHEFATTRLGYRQAVAWFVEHGPIGRVGVEGSSSYGRGISASLRRHGIEVVEVNRTRPAERRKQGKTDQLDAYRAARSVLSGEATTAPKSESIEPLRAINTARRSAVKAQKAAWLQIGSILVNASPKLRDKHRDLSREQLVETLAAARPDQVRDDGEATTVRALRSLARRHLHLGEEIDDLEAQLETLASNANPALMAIKSIGAVLAAQLLITAGDNPDRLRSSASFAALCGTAPVPVASGRTSRHRCSHGGDRQANSALHQIAKVRMSFDPRTRAYKQARLAKGWTTKAVFRGLKRAIAREVYQALIGNCQIPNYTDLRPVRQAKNITLTAAAQHLGLWPTTISRLELGKSRDDDLADRYRQWLQAA